MPPYEIGLEEFESGAEEFDSEEAGAALNLVNRLRARKGKSPMRRLPSPPAVLTGPRGLALKRLPLGIGTVTFGAATGTSLTVEVEPQRGYTPKRLVAAVSRTGASATGLVRLTSLMIGDVQQLPASNGVPIEMFDTQATDAELDLTPVIPGQKVTLTLTISAAPAGADTVVVNLGFYGAAIGQ